MNIALKPANVEQILNFANNNPLAIEPTKLKALYALIQKKGEPIETEDPKLNGVFCLRITKNQLIAIKRIGPKDKFFPCALNTYLLNEI